MLNILEEYNATSEQRIDDKTDLYSVTTGDVGQTIREGVELALLYPQSNVLFTYPKDFITRDVAYNLFIALADNVNGDTTNGANWQPLSSGTSQSVYDLGTITDDFANGYEATVPAIVSYSTSNIYLFKPDNTNTGASTLQINALAVLPIRKYSYSAIVDIESGDLDLANTYLLIYKTTYFLIASGGVSSGGGSGTSLTDTITAGENLVENDLVYLSTDGKYFKSDNVNVPTCSTELRLVTDATILAGATGQSLSIGLKDGFTGLSAGQLYYVGENGAICLYDDIPDIEGIIVRSIGTAKSSTELEFNPDETYIETTLIPTPTFDPLVDTIGDITPVNTAIVDNDTINDFASKTQGQIDALIPLAGSDLITGDLKNVGLSWRIGTTLNKIEFTDGDSTYISSSTGGSATILELQSTTNKYARLATSTGSDLITDFRVLLNYGNYNAPNFQFRNGYAVYDADRTSAIDLDSLALINRGYADARYALAGNVSSNISEIVATANIAAFKAVDGNGVESDSANVGTRNKCVGVSKAAILSGFSGEVVTSGEITNGAWSFIAGNIIYLNSNTLSTTAPTSGFSQIIGVAKSATVITVDIKQAILI